MSTQGIESGCTFAARLQQERVRLTRSRIETVQINLGRRCNQACAHCHVAAGPERTEMMDAATLALAAELVETSGATTVDLTGGAPELNQGFRALVRRLRQPQRRIIDRCNLTVCFEEGQQDLPEFLAECGVEVVASLPCYTESNVDAQRGGGVFEKSIAALKKLNALGYGRQGSGLILNLVYNPGGPSLPGAQAQLEAAYKRELASNFAIEFNHLLTITNVPVGRFAERLSAAGKLDGYCTLLEGAFNAGNLGGLMCRSMLSVAWDGRIYDCDFNQMLERELGDGSALQLGKTPVQEILREARQREVAVGGHCFACTAGAGSSCGGALQ